MSTEMTQQTAVKGTVVAPAEDADGIPSGCAWDDTELENAKSVKESMDAIHGFTGLMAGFEGFIINEYINQDGTPDSANFSWTFEFGLWLLIMSFVLNLAAAMAAFLFGVFIREGIYRPWFMYIVGRLTKLMATGGVVSFVFGVLLFVDTIGLKDGFQYTIYGTSMVLFFSFLGLFVYTMVTANDHVDTWKTVMQRVN